MKAATISAVHRDAERAISIHAAREGGDQDGRQPLAPVRISIHAAREGGDKANPQLKGEWESFQSTPPVKAATRNILGIMRPIRFQSTPPVKAATRQCICRAQGGSISIHAAREGGDIMRALSPT